MNAKLTEIDEELKQINDAKELETTPPDAACGCAMWQSLGLRCGRRAGHTGAHVTNHNGRQYWTLEEARMPRPAEVAGVKTQKEE